MPHNPAPASPPTYKANVTTYQCQKCEKPFPHITVIQVEKMRKLVIDGAFVSHMVFQCPRCAAMNYHNMNEKQIEEQNKMLFEILGIMHGQTIVKIEDDGAIINSDKSTG